MTSNFLLLNSDKTEILLIGPKNSTQNLLDYNLQLDGCNVTSSKVKNLGVILDSNLSFENHISHVTKTALFHLRNISKLQNMLTFSDAEKLVHAFMTSKLDYCKAKQGKFIYIAHFIHSGKVPYLKGSEIVIKKQGNLFLIKLI